MAEKDTEKKQDTAEPKDEKQTDPKSAPAKDEKDEKDGKKDPKDKDLVPAEKAAAKADADEDDDDGDEEEINPDDLFKRRKSIDLTPENAKFYPSAGGMVSLEVDGPEGHETFERVVILRSFPITAPDEFLSVREPDTRKKGRGAEIGMIRRLEIFDEATKKLINEELELRYFTPVITKITSQKEKFGYSYWEAETTAGKVSFVLNNPFSNIRVLEDKRIYISDMDGNSFMIPDPTKLDRASYRRIEIYI